MKLVDLCIRRPVATTMFIGFLVVLGWFSYRQLTVDLFPNIDFPIVHVTTTLSGASVEEMEKTFDYAKLDDEAKLSYDLWKLQYENARDGLPFMVDGYAFDQMNGAQGFWPTFLISFHKVEEESDFTAYVSRLRATGRAFDQLLERARSSAASGVRPPKLTRMKGLPLSRPNSNDRS